MILIKKGSHGNGSFLFRDNSIETIFGALESAKTDSGYVWQSCAVLFFRVTFFVKNIMI